MQCIYMVLPPNITMQRQGGLKSKGVVLEYLGLLYRVVKTKHPYSVRKSCCVVVKGPRVKRRSRSCLICIEIYIRKPTAIPPPSHSIVEETRQENNFVGCGRRGRRTKRKEEEQQQKRTNQSLFLYSELSYFTLSFIAAFIHFKFCSLEFHCDKRDLDLYKSTWNYYLS